MCAKSKSIIIIFTCIFSYFLAERIHVHFCTIFPKINILSNGEIISYRFLVRLF